MLAVALLAGCSAQCGVEAARGAGGRCETTGTAPSGGQSVDDTAIELGDAAVNAIADGCAYDQWGGQVG